MLFSFCTVVLDFFSVTLLLLLGGFGGGISAQFEPDFLSATILIIIIIVPLVLTTLSITG